MAVRKDYVPAVGHDIVQVHQERLVELHRVVARHGHRHILCFALIPREVQRPARRRVVVVRYRRRVVRARVVHGHTGVHGAVQRHGEGEVRCARRVAFA